MPGRLAAFSLLPLALAACGPAPGDPGDACGASTMQFLVDRPASILDGVALPENTRVLRPGQPATMDFRPDRMTITVDEAGRIVRVDCV
ncbi:MULTISPECIES: I78 family peptidase inhibitor [unclassified Rhodosalinus]|uniref:I78 family peptidase inhibitor n=1 Tax=unclassified Rhodosalinus TaxID=2630183 RepID=UPI0035240927